MLISYQNTEIMVKPLRVEPVRPAAPSAAAPVPLVGEGKRGALGHLAYLLRQASAAVRLKHERAFAELDVTLPQFSVLTMIAAYQSVSGADLARLTFLTPQTVNVITRNLVKRGAIMRQPDAMHGRIIRLQITELGRRLLKTCRSRADRIEAGLTTALSPSQERVVRDWLIDIAKELNERA
jgi:DNA-binding MarR family transcriptional regulator